MKSFIEYVVESLNSPVNLVRYHQEGNEHKYLFNHKNHGYRVTITHDSKSAYVTFSSSTGGEYNARRSRIHATGDVGSHAAKVMSTIHHIIRHHMIEHPSINTVLFTSDPEETSRVKLYTKYTSSLGGNSKRYNKFNNVHEIPAQSYRLGGPITESNDLHRIKLTKSSGNATQFIKDLVSDSDEHPFNSAARILHGAIVHVSPVGNQIHLHDIQTLEPRSGAGTKALKHLTSLADKHGVKIGIHAKAYSKRPEYITSTPRLIKWYKKHGFQHDEPDYDPDYGSEMTYYPK